MNQGWFACYYFPLDLQMDRNCGFGLFPSSAWAVNRVAGKFVEKFMLFFCLLELPTRLLQEGSWALHASFSKRVIMVQDQVKVETADWLSLLLPCFIYLFIWKCRFDEGICYAYWWGRTWIKVGRSTKLFPREERKVGCVVWRGSPGWYQGRLVLGIGMGIQSQSIVLCWKLTQNNGPTHTCVGMME